MLSFKEYVALLESILDGSSFENYDGNYEHGHIVDGHHVRVYYSKAGPNRFAIDFNVNHSFGSNDSKQAKGETSHKIATFVKASVNHFIKNVKPASLYAKGNSMQKHALYGKYFEHAAKKNNKYEYAYEPVLGHELYNPNA